MERVLARQCREVGRAGGRVGGDRGHGGACIDDLPGQRNGKRAPKPRRRACVRCDAASGGHSAIVHDVLANIAVPGTIADNTPDPITIKKYANRRLYNTATSKYVTLDDRKSTRLNSSH